MNNPFESIDKRLTNLEALMLDVKHSSNELKQNFVPKEPTEYMTRGEVAELLKCDLSTIHNWVKKGKISPYGLGGKIFFKRSEIEAVMIPLGKKKGGSDD
jgi:excisionase family DNA binding protein